MQLRHFYSVLVFVLIVTISISCPNRFKIAQFCFSPPVPRLTLRTVLGRCEEGQTLTNELVSVAICMFDSAINNTLSHHGIITGHGLLMKDLSFHIAKCAYQALSFWSSSMYNIEILYQTALVLYPANSLVAKNYAHILEVNGCSEMADSLLQQVGEISSDRGLIVQHLFGGSIVRSEFAGIRSFSRIVSRSLQALQSAALYTETITHPFYDIRALQGYYQYYGINPGIIAELYAQTIYSLYPQLSLQNEDVFTVSVLRNAGSRLPFVSPNKRRLKIGIVAEQYYNSSPGLCIVDLLVMWMQLYGDSIELVTFDWPNSPLVFTARMGDIGRIVDLQENDIELSTSLITQEDVDVLVYLALPTDKLTFMLSLTRLAPIQVQYGIGHPLSSGSPVIDYSIVSSLMMPAQMKQFGMKIPRSYSITECLQFLDEYMMPALNLTSQMIFGLASDYHMENIQFEDIEHSQNFLNSCSFGATGSRGQHYTEQLVYFDSLGRGSCEVAV